MDDLQGLWSVFFQSNFQTLGSGVIVFTGDRILGGDAAYYYDGHVEIQGNKADAKVKIVRFNPAGMSIFGNLASFNLAVSGTITAPDMEFHGYMVEQPNMKITIKCKKITSV
jgi:autotransporter translocation and assembly factor TamB